MRLSPAFYYVDLTTLVRDYFFSNTSFGANYATAECMEQEYFARGIQVQQVSEAYTGMVPEVCRLQEALGGITVGTNKRVFCLEIGHDGFNPFNNSQYSVWGVWARCRNVSPQFLSSRCNMYPVMLLPPKVDTPACLSLLAKELR